MVDDALLHNVSENVIIKYLENDQFIFTQDEPCTDYFYIVKEGAVQIIREEQNTNILVDKCDEGDVFGLRPLIAKMPYVVSAQAVESTLLYSIHIDDFQEIFDNNPKVSFYLASNFAAGVRNKYAKNNKGRFFSSMPINETRDTQIIEVQSIGNRNSPVTCSPQTTIREAALIMTENRVGSIIIVDQDLHPIGILTDKDFRKKVLVGHVSPDQAISTIMTFPVITTIAKQTVAEVQIKMLKHKIHHLCLTKDGSPNSKVVGVISEHDLLIVQANSPAVMIKKIRTAQSGADLKNIRDSAEVLLKKYLAQEVSIKFISEIMSEINDAIIVRAIQIGEDDLSSLDIFKPSAKFCWLGLGSEGRKEQLLRTDQDNALIFEDNINEDIELVRDYFLRLASNVTIILHECGFEYCPADMMASNPKWCKSVSEWENQFTAWMSSPGPKEVMMTTIFYDFRPIYGAIELSENLTHHIFENIDQQEFYLVQLAKGALQNPPPLSFFRNFVVENDGAHKDQFDIKARAMMPLADAARLLILNEKVGQINNTFERFDKLAELDENNKELFEQAADAYEILMRFRASQGLKNKNGGRFFNVHSLNKMERLMLRNSFKPISELHSLIKVRFRLSLLGL